MEEEKEEGIVGWNSEDNRSIVTDIAIHIK